VILDGVGRTIDKNRAPNKIDVYHMLMRKNIANSTQGIRIRFAGIRLRAGCPIRSSLQSEDGLNPSNQAWSELLLYHLRESFPTVEMLERMAHVRGTGGTTCHYGAL
jgi:hypothetical protein